MRTVLVIATILGVGAWSSLGAMPQAAPAKPGDAARGATLYKTRCAMCHVSGRNGVGPNLAGIVGRPAGSVAGYTYSRGFAAYHAKWTPAAIEAFLANPRGVVPGTKMPIAVPAAQDRADIVAHMVATGPR